MIRSGRVQMGVLCFFKKSNETLNCKSKTRENGFQSYPCMVGYYNKIHSYLICYVVNSERHNLASYTCTKSKIKCILQMKGYYFLEKFILSYKFKTEHVIHIITTF